jgi:hypothetical protein
LKKNSKKQPLSLGEVKYLDDKEFKAWIKEIIAENVSMKSKDNNFPKLPKIFKTDTSGKIAIYELTLKSGKPNRMHTASVMYGYLKRRENYYRNTGMRELERIASKIISEELLDNPEDYEMVII